MAKPEVSLSLRLQAFDRPDCCRVAVIIQEALPQVVTHKAITARWAERHPIHTGARGRLSADNRIAYALWAMKAAGIVGLNGSRVEVLDTELQAMSAANLPVVVGDDDMGLAPSERPNPPAVPDDLRAFQAVFTGPM